LPILRSLSRWLPGIGALFVEYHDEHDRREIDRMLEGTHLLYQARVTVPHRGELCYVATSRLPRDFRGAQIRKIS
jgi:hypothetical protein